VGEDYYLATSTFEWFPGILIYHSKDLANWELVQRPLNRSEQLQLAGVPSSGGVYAPCLSYDNGTYFLVYSVMYTRNGLFKDHHNYLIHTNDLRGDWCNPIFLNSSGIDPSLFHDEDGTKWVTHMLRLVKEGNRSFGGIVLQQYSEAEQRLVGPVYPIFEGTALGITEGPHLYRRNGWYYLLTAEGGTSYGHAVTLARSRAITGPYEVCPKSPILTSKGFTDAALQKAGHADLVDSPDGRWYMVHLCGRPIGDKRCILGRETAIQNVVWTDDDWLELEGGGQEPRLEVRLPARQLPLTDMSFRDEFDSAELSTHYQSLRIPLGDEMYSLSERPGYLRLKGHESIHSRHRQSLIARRQQSFVFRAETAIDYEPAAIQQMAGLIYLYDVDHYYYLRVYHEPGIGKSVGVIACQHGKHSVFGAGQPSEFLLAHAPVYLRAEVEYERLQFHYSTDKERWQTVGPVLDASLLSDELVPGGFTGAFIGICCQDLSGGRAHADFDYFEYRERTESASHTI
jgi:xylan 1,4-beta-xylosidase